MKTFRLYPCDGANWHSPWDVAAHFETEFFSVSVSEEAGQMRADEAIADFRKVWEPEDEGEFRPVETQLRSAWQAALSIAVVVDEDAKLWFRTTALHRQPLALLFQPFSPEKHQWMVAKRAAQALGYSLQAIRSLESAGPAAYLSAPAAGKMSEPKTPDEDWSDEDWSDEEEFDEWCEAHAELSDQGDLEGVIRLCRERFNCNPDDAHALEALADALNENGQHEEAIELVEPFYQNDPDHPVAEGVILDALLAQKKSIEAYPWVRPPCVVSLDDSVLDAIHRQLKPKRKPRPLYEVFYFLVPEGYPLFTEADLLTALKADPRFLVTESEIEDHSGISVTRGR